MLQPIVKTTVKASDAKLNTKSKPTTGPNKLVTLVTTLSKNKEPETSSLCENITQESIHEQLPSDGDFKPSTSDIVTKKSSRRRRSYTSLLVEGSKVDISMFNGPFLLVLFSFLSKFNNVTFASICS